MSYGECVEGYAIAYMYTGKKVSKIKVYNSRTNGIVEFNPIKLIEEFAEGRVSLNNIGLEPPHVSPAHHDNESDRFKGFKIRGVDGKQLLISKYNESSELTTKEIFVVTCKFKESGDYKLIDSNGSFKTVSSEEAYNLAKSKQLSNFKCSKGKGVLDIVPLVEDYCIPELYPEKPVEPKKVEPTVYTLINEAYSISGKFVGYVTMSPWNSMYLYTKDCGFSHSNSLKDFTDCNRVLKGYEVESLKDGTFGIKDVPPLPKLIALPIHLYEGLVGDSPPSDIRVNADKYGCVVTEDFISSLKKKCGVSNLTAYSDLTRLESYSGTTFMPYAEKVKKLLKSLVTDDVINAISTTMKYLKEDSEKSPFTDFGKWKPIYVKNNISNGMSFKDAPIGELLMTTSYEFGTIYERDRGTGLNECSIIIKLSDTIMYCVYGTYWQVKSSGDSYYTYTQKGFFTVSDSPRGNVCPLKSVNLSKEEVKPASQPVTSQVTSQPVVQQKPAPKAVKVQGLHLNGAIVGYRFVLDNNLRCDIDLDSAKKVGLAGIKLENYVKLFPHGDEYLSQNEITTGKRVHDISDNLPLCNFYTKNIIELNK